jgi:hypothetical protein
VNEHEQKERPEIVHPPERKDCRPTDQVAHPEKPLGGEISVGELIAEEHADERGQRERAEHERLLPCGKIKAWQITEDQRQPGAPDEELQEHHGQQSATH